MGVVGGVVPVAESRYSITEATTASIVNLDSVAYRERCGEVV